MEFKIISSRSEKIWILIPTISYWKSDYTKYKMGIYHTVVLRWLKFYIGVKIKTK